MDTRRFGKTERLISEFSLGGMRYQQSWRDTGQAIDPASQANLGATVDTALSAGINHIETARGYGTSERQLGIALQDFERDSFILQTKIAPTPDPAIFRSHLEESFARLQVPFIDFVALHGLNTYEDFWWGVRPDGCWSVCRELQRQGRIGNIGFSTHGAPELITDIVDWVDDTGAGFDYVNLHWYYIWQRNEAALQAAHDQDLGVFIISPADKGGMLYRPSARIVELTAPLSPLAFNSAYCLRRPEIQTLSLGAARPSDLDPLPDVARAGTQPELIEEADKRLRDTMVATMGVARPEELLPGLPTYERTPHYLNLPVMVWLSALWQAWDLTEFVQNRYALLGNGGSWFPGNNASRLEDVDLAKVVRKSPHAEQIPAWLTDLHRRFGGASLERLSKQ